MKHRKGYTYVVLRYVHDIATSEFVNVGVVVYSQDLNFLGAKFKTTYGRVKKVFPTLDGESFRRNMRRLQSAFDRLAEGDLAVTIKVDATKSTLSDVVNSIIRQDDSSLQWSPMGGGVTDTPELLLSHLFSRFVTKHDEEVVRGQRKDEDVWKCFRSELEKRNVILHLEEKTIKVEDDSIKFSHAWKNGLWHCYEPVSFDLSSDSSIKDKAHRWLGQVSSVQSATEDFQVFFLVGKPSSLAHQDAYEKAVSILRKTPKSIVIEEQDAEIFSKDVALEIQLHQQGDI